jgi:uncharacterized membrane protein YgcG
MKRLSRVVAVLGLLLVTLWAAPAAPAAPALVVDGGNLFSASEEAALLGQAQTIQAQYNFNAVVYTEPRPSGQTPTDTAVAAYQDNYSGDGIILYVAIQTRDYFIWTTGGRGEETFNRYGFDQVLLPEVENVLRSGDYYRAADTYLDLVRDFLAQAATGEPYDYGNRYRGYNPFLVAGAIGAGVGLIAAGVTVAIWKRGLKTARPALEAASYQTPGSLKFSVAEDEMVHTFTAVTPIPRQETRGFGGGGGGGSFSVGGGRGGGGKF